MKHIFRVFTLLFLFTAVSNLTKADEKTNVVKQGTVRGRIIDTSKQTLPGASVYIEKLHAGVTSDVNGFYTFPNLEPGTYTVKVSYVGYSPVELKITIPEGRTLEKDVILNEGLELQEVVVGGAFPGSPAGGSILWDQNATFINRDNAALLIHRKTASVSRM